jgi:3-deoxy-D-manno-octulosonic-acid transferase
VLMGPHTFNFAEAAERSLAAGASHRVADLADGVALAVSLAADPARDAGSQRCQAFADAHRGAAARIARAVLQVVDARAATTPGAPSSG